MNKHVSLFYYDQYLSDYGKKFYFWRPTFDLELHMVVTSTELYIFTLVLVTLTFFQSHKV